jgi:transcriptional regulator
MYVPSHFEETRVEVLHELIRECSFAALVTLGSDGLDANHIPFELDAAPAPLGTLRAHVARGNPVWRDFSRDLEVLVVFQGPQAYITPSWYETKKETGRVVPTYNYAVVHAHGPLRVVEDHEWLRGLVERLTTRYEASRPQPWKVADAPGDFVDKQLGAIVGLEIPIARLVGKWKVSQNRPAADRDGVARGLREIGDANAVAMSSMVERCAHSEPARPRTGS